MKKLLLSVFLTLLLSFSVFAQDDSKQKSETDNLQKNERNSLSNQDRPEGIVRLRVTFLASGEIGEITVISKSPKSLIEEAVKAARNIKFEPAKKNGVPYTVTKNVEYTFTLFYHKENDEDLQKNAEITQMPVPEYPKGEKLKELSGKVKLTLNLFPNGDVKVTKIESDLPKEFEQKAREAASKIKFKPAIHKKGNKVTQTKEIEYEFKPQKN